MERTVSIEELIAAIRRLRSDEPRDDPRVWYRTQKEHWLGWLGQSHTEGAYGRVPGQNHDAKYAYNHVVNPQLLLYLIKAAGGKEDLVAAAQEASDTGTTMMQQSGAVRRVVPWPVVYEALFVHAPPRSRR